MRVLPVFYSALKPNGSLILHEPILNENESAPRFCSTGQGMILRPVKEIERWITKNFLIYKKKDMIQFKNYPTQRMWWLKKKPIIRQMKYIK